MRANAKVKYNNDASIMATQWSMKNAHFCTINVFFVLASTRTSAILWTHLFIHNRPLLICGLVYRLGANWLTNWQKILIFCLIRAQPIDAKQTRRVNLGTVHKLHIVGRVITVAVSEPDIFQKKIISIMKVHFHFSPIQLLDFDICNSRSKSVSPLEIEVSNEVLANSNLTSGKEFLRRGLQKTK